MWLMQFTTSENGKEHDHERQWGVVEAKCSTRFFTPGPLCLLLLQGPRHCRCFPPAEENSAKWEKVLPSLYKDTLKIQQYGHIYIFPTRLMCTTYLPTICQTCMMLSSDTEQITHGSLGFQEKSEIFAVCPPWMNWEKIQINGNLCNKEHGS